jgi:hypothetical protein
LQEYPSFAEAQRDLDDYITFYNNERPHSALNDQSPVEFRVNLSLPCRLIVWTYGVHYNRYRETVHPELLHPKKKFGEAFYNGLLVCGIFSESVGYVESIYGCDAALTSIRSLMVPFSIYLVLFMHSCWLTVDQESR